MKRQPFFPKILSEQPEWYQNLATELPGVNVTLGLPALTVTGIVNDAKYEAHATGAWLTWAREVGPTATAALAVLADGTGSEPYVLPGLAAPDLPVGLVAVAPGAKRRILAFMQTIKSQPGYTEAIGQLLRIIGAEETAVHPLPTFTLKMERGGGCECVKIIYAKYGRPGVVIWSRRGNGPREQLGVSLNSPYLDERPLLVPGQPEQREYWLQYFDGNKPDGALTDAATVTVAP